MTTPLLLSLNRTIEKYAQIMPTRWIALARRHFRGQINRQRATRAYEFDDSLSLP